MFNAIQFNRAFNAVIEAYGVGHSVSACVYATRGVPICIIGAALVEMGVDPYELENREKNAYAMLPEYVSGLSDNELFAYDAAQSVQDGNAAWGAAKYAFDAVRRGGMRPSEAYGLSIMVQEYEGVVVPAPH